MHEQFQEYLQDRLSGLLRDNNGEVMGPSASWKGPQQAAASRSPAGDRVEPAADRQPAAHRLHLPRKDGYGAAPVVKNGPALTAVPLGIRS
jgi:hypothetical protein